MGVTFAASDQTPEDSRRVLVARGPQGNVFYREGDPPPVFDGPPLATRVPCHLDQARAGSGRVPGPATEHLALKIVVVLLLLGATGVAVYFYPGASIGLLLGALFFPYNRR
jgi:hypothetical protein